MTTLDTKRELEILRGDVALMKTRAEVAERYVERFREALVRIMMEDDKSSQGRIAEEALSP